MSSIGTSDSMSVYPTIAEKPGSRHAWLVAAVAVAVALIAVAVASVIAFRSGSSTAVAVRNVPTDSAVADARRDQPLMSLTPAALAEGALGSGYQLPQAQHGPTLAAVLAAMDPQTRRYTKAIMRLTFAQLAAGAAGHP